MILHRSANNRAVILKFESKQGVLVRYFSPMIVLCLSFFLILACSRIYGQSLGRIKSPEPGDTLKNHEVFVLFKLDTSIRIRKSSIKAFVEKEEISTLVKVSGQYLSIVITGNLFKGKNEIYISAEGSKGKTYYKRWSFYVLKGKKAQKYFEEKEDTTEKSKVSFSGNLDAESRITEVKGPGASLRQEPGEIHNLRFNANLKHEKYQIPVSLYLTNLDRSTTQPRNRFKVGFKTRRFEVEGGDLNPYYHKLILNGARIRGVEAGFHLGNAELNIIHGRLRRKINGRIRHYQITDGIPPGNLQPDSTYVESGTYRRNVTAGNLSFSSFNNSGGFNITFLKSTDDTTSVQFGENPAQNLVIGAQTSYNSKFDVLRLKGGVALSMTTRDISKGIISAEEIKKNFNQSSPVEPSDFAGFIIINSTTTPIKITKKQSMAYYVNGRLKFLNQHITASYEKNGPVYESFGNPFLLNDRQVIRIRDRMDFWKRRIRWSLFASKINNNLSGNKLSTSTTDRIGTNLNFQPNARWPGLFASYSYYLRKNIFENTGQPLLDMNLQTIMGGSNYTFKTGPFQHSIQINYYQISSIDRISNFLQQSTRVYGGNFTEKLPGGFSINARIQKYDITNDSVRISGQTAYDISAGFHTKKDEFRIYGGHSNILMINTLFTPQSQRTRNYVRIHLKLLKSLRFSLEGGISEFSEPENVKRRYEENYIHGRLIYLFDI